MLTKQELITLLWGNDDAVSASQPVLTSHTASPEIRRDSVENDSMAERAFSPGKAYVIQFAKMFDGQPSLTDTLCRLNGVDRQALRDDLTFIVQRIDELADEAFRKTWCSGAKVDDE